MGFVETRSVERASAARERRRRRGCRAPQGDDGRESARKREKKDGGRDSFVRHGTESLRDHREADVRREGAHVQKEGVKGMTQENLEPWYANINPKMEVPSVSLASGGEKKYITDSRDIIEYFEKTHEGGTSLVDPKKSREIWSMVDLCYQIKLAAL